jgi:hypothetical protein
MSVDRLLNQLDKVKETASGCWLACCPAHDDRTPSLSIRETTDGTILIHCWAGCGAIDVVAALGMDMRDLFPTQIENRLPIKPQDRWIPRDAIKALEFESMICVIAASAMASGKTLTEEDNKRLFEAARRFHAAAREVGFD